MAKIPDYEEAVTGVQPGQGRSIATHSPANVAALDARDPGSGFSSHQYGIQFGGPGDMLKIQFQHGPRGGATSTPGVFDDDLLAIEEDRLEGFQAGPFCCDENAEALAHIKAARAALGRRVAARISKGVLGALKAH